MLDLNVCDGRTCMAAIKSGASLVGVAFNQAHIDLLYERLECEVFREFQQPDSGLYEASLVSLLGPSKKRKPNNGGQGGEVMVLVFPSTTGQSQNP